MFANFDISKVHGMMDKVKNAVMNYSEFELKVREATNTDPWGASSTMMMEIANGTHNVQHFYEIMNTIYKRMQEPVGPTWRITYKAIQLLEFLIKNGAEKCIDSARDHIYELKALLNYNYIDEKRKDQGINIQHRAKEIIDLLGDDSKIRFERQRAKENRNKYGGVSSEQVRNGYSGGFSTSGRGGNDDANYDDNSYSKFSDVEAKSNSQSGYEQPKIQTVKVTEPIRVDAIPKVSAAPPKEANLLDFDDDWSDFKEATSPNVNASPVAPAFASFNNTAAPQAFASFPPPKAQTVNATQPSFASFANTTTAKQNTTLGLLGADDDFSDFQGTQPAPVNLLNSPPKNYGLSHQMNSGQNAIPKPVKNDAFSNLVSLDAVSLTSNGKKEQVGPSLNSLGTPQFPIRRN